MSLANSEIIRVSCRFKNDVVGDVVNVYYLNTIGAVSDDDATVMGLVSDWLDNIYSSLSLMSDENVPYDYKVDVVERSGGKEVIVRNVGVASWSLTTDPSGSTDAMPQGCTAVVNFRTERPQSKGRKYLGTWIDSSANGDTWVGSVPTALATAAGYILTAITGTGGTLVPGLLSMIGEGEATMGAGFYSFTEAVVNNIVGYMRSRKRGRGS